MVVLTVVTGGAASAANPDIVTYGSSPCGDLQTSTWAYNGSEWNTYPALKGEFEDGFYAWAHDVERYNGGWLITKGGQSWTARWQDLGSTSNARTVCFVVHNIEFNTQKLSAYNDPANPLTLTQVAAHEWGHAFGLGHSGDDDAFAGGPATMATCVTSTARETLSNDDEAALTSQFETSGGYDTITANASFEENESGHLEWWTQVGSPSFYASSSGGGADGSPWYALFKNQHWYTRIENSTIIPWTVSGNLKARVNYRKASSIDSGNVKLFLYPRWHMYQGNIVSSCANLNSTLSPGGWVDVSTTCYPGTYWSYCSTPVMWQDTGGTNGRLHTRVAVYNNMERPIDGSGYPTYVKVDRTRVMLNR